MLPYQDDVRLEALGGRADDLVEGCRHRRIARVACTGSEQAPEGTIMPWQRRNEKGTNMRQVCSDGLDSAVVPTPDNILRGILHDTPLSI